ncbi:MAG: M48 family metalloprotease, partial [Deltaproteobacteria bacterium]|nr:M48 family metalloprotease [Deltaproteobacteria bacterium]
MNKRKMLRDFLKALSKTFNYLFIALFLAFIPSYNECMASLFFINNKDEIEEGYKQQALFERSSDPVKMLKIQQVGERLAKVSRKRKGIEYIFSLIKPENAFSGFAGFIYVGEPLYNLVNSDDELAFIIAHEMAHSDNRDTADSIEQNIAERYEGQEETKISISEDMLKGFFFNRIQEYRADSQATLYLYLAGYDPEAGIRVMDKFQKKYGLYPPGMEKVKGHPSH